MKLQMFSRLANLGISGMLFLGFGVAIIAMIILSVTAWRGFSSIAVNSTAVTEKAQNVNNEMTKVSIDTKQASEDTRLLVETVEKKIMPATRLSVQDMIGLEEVFEEIVETFAQLTEQENLSVDDFIMEAEDILEMIKRENLPLVRSIRGDTEENSKHMQDMVNTLKEFEKNLQSSVAKTLGAAQASSVILEDARNAQQKAGDTKSAMAVTAVIIGFLLIGFSIFIGNAIIGPIKTLTAGMRDISEGEGDLTKRVSLKSKDELGELAHWFNVFVERIQNIMINIAGNSETLASSAAELYATAEQSYKGTEKQSGQVGEVATSMEEMSATISEVAKKSLAVSESAKSASEAATTGGKVVLEAIKGMSRIESSVKESAAIIEELGKSSQQIGEIISVIDDIADQTNLLALNAAIEAARAGEQGRGFAVVADEVRKLAERTTRATKEISVMIQAIQSNTLKAVSSMEGGTKDVSSGVQLINQAGESLENILGMIKDVTTNIEGIATSSEQQSATAEDISKNTAIASEVSTELSTGAEQSSKAAKQVSVLAGQLKEIVEQFKL